MSWMLFLFAVLAGVAGLFVLGAAASVLHEIAAFLCWLAVGSLEREVKAARSEVRRALARGARDARES